MKRALALVLSLVMLLGMLAGCQSAPGGEATVETTAPTPTQSAEEQEVLKLLIIGNSHSEDATWALAEVFQKEAPNQKFVIASLYYSGCYMSQHSDFITNNKPEYIYNKNVDGSWQRIENATVKMALDDQQWDIVSLQQMNHNIGVDEGYVAEEYLTVLNHIFENQKIAPKIAFHAPWANPDDYDLYLKDGAPFMLNAGWREDHEAKFPGADGKYSQRVLYEAQMTMLQKYLVDSTSFLGRNYFDMIVPTATPIQYAHDVLERPLPELYRDYTHLTDYGRLMVAYYWYARLMNLESISQVNVSNIPSHVHFNKSAFPRMPELEITQDMKDDIITSVNWALAHPFEVPAQ